jgi:hypothetical protein
MKNDLAFYNADALAVNSKVVGLVRNSKKTNIFQVMNFILRTMTPRQLDRLLELLQRDCQVMQEMLQKRLQKRRQQKGPGKSYQKVDCRNVTLWTGQSWD